MVRLGGTATVSHLEVAVFIKNYLFTKTGFCS